MNRFGKQVLELHSCIFISEFNITTQVFLLARDDYKTNLSLHSTPTPTTNIIISVELSISAIIFHYVY